MFLVRNYLNDTNIENTGFTTSPSPINIIPTIPILNNNFVYSNHLFNIGFLQLPNNDRYILVSTVKQKDEARSFLPCIYNVIIRSKCD